MQDTDLPPEIPPIEPLNQPVAPPKKKRRWRGCLWALLICFCLMIVLAVTGVLVVRSLLKKAVRDYTTTQPVEIPIAQVTPEEGKAIADRAQKWFADLKAGAPVDPLTLTTDDLNRLIALSGTNQLAGKLTVDLSDGKLRGRICLPLDKVGQPDLVGRYLNADVTLKASIAGGELRVFADDIRANDKSIPGFILRKVKERNLADEFMNQQDVFATIQLLESVTITNGALIVMPKM